MQKRLYWSITIVALQNQIHSYNSLQQFCFAKIIFFYLVLALWVFAAVWAFL